MTVRRMIVSTVKLQQQPTHMSTLINLCPERGGQLSKSKNHFLKVPRNTSP